MTRTRGWLQNLPKRKYIDFAEEYARNGENATAAYYATINPDATEAGAASEASRLLRHPDVIEVIVRARQKAMKKLEVTEEWIIQRLLAIAAVDPEDVLAEDGTIRPIHDIPKNVRQTLAFEHDNRNGLKLKASDRMKAIELLGRCKKMFTDKVEHSGEMSLAQIIHDLDNRAAPEPDDEMFQ